VNEIIKSEFNELLISSVDLGQGEPLDRKVTQESLRFSQWSKRPKDIAFLTSRLVREREQEEQLGRICRRGHLLFVEEGTNSKEEAH